jgi:anti-sigma factor RsiW
MSLHAQDWLDAYLDGELSPTELARAEQHLSVCAECRALLAQRRECSACCKMPRRPSGAQRKAVHC